MAEADRSINREERVAQTLVDLADTLVDHFDVIEFLNMLSERCVELLDVNEAGILLADHRRRLAVPGTSNERVELVALFELQRADGPGYKAFEANEDAAIDDLHASTDVWRDFATQSLAAGFRSVHCVPMRLRADVIGTVSLLRRSEGTLQSGDVELARALASMATIGILQNRALDESKVTSTQLQLALNSRVRNEQAKGVLAERHSTTID